MRNQARIDRMTPIERIQLALELGRRGRALQRLGERIRRGSGR